MSTKSWVEVIPVTALKVGDCIFIQTLAYNLNVKQVKQESDNVYIRWGNHPSQARWFHNDETVERIKV